MGYVEEGMPKVRSIEDVRDLLDLLHTRAMDGLGDDHPVLAILDRAIGKVDDLIYCDSNHERVLLIADLAEDDEDDDDDCFCPGCHRSRSLIEGNICPNCGTEID